MPKSALKCIVAFGVSLAFFSCEAPQIEWITAGGEAYVNTWISINGEPVTCFVSEGTQREIYNIYRSGKEPSFRYGGFLFSFSRRKVKVYDNKEILIEELPLKKYIFILRDGTYQKLQINEAIAERISRDYRGGGGGGDLVDYLRSSGYEL